MRRLHIVGCPRSGTTLLMQLVSTCFANNGHCSHEMSIFQPPDITSGLYISKQPNDIRQLRHIFFRDKNLYVICMDRDPRSVIASIHRQRPGEYFCNYRIWRECDKAAQRYLGHPRFLQLGYDDLVSYPDKAQGLISSQFPFLQREYSFSDYQQHATPSTAAQQAMNGMREPSRDSLGKWHEHLPRVAEQYLRHPQLADDLVRLGYEPDRRWLEELRDVTATPYPCRYSEQRERFKEWEKAMRVYLKSRRYLRQMTR